MLFRLLLATLMITGLSASAQAGNSFAKQEESSVKLRLGQWNVGLWNNGLNPSGIPDANLEKTILELKELFATIAADILVLNEYVPNLNKEDTKQPILNAYTTLLQQLYPYSVTGGYYTGVFSKYPLVMDNFILPEVKRNALKGVVIVNGKVINLCFLHGSPFDVSSRVSDFKIVVNQFNDSDYVIIAGDFNIGNNNDKPEEISQQMSIFENAGFFAGNRGRWGVINTHSSNKSLDNIMVKGFDMDSYIVLNERSVSDHFPTYAVIDIPKEKYTLTYMVDGEIYKSYDIEFGATIAPEAEPTKEGYTFSGWSEIPQTMPADDVTITGTFTVNNYKLTYMVDDEIYKSYDIEFGATITPEAEPTKEGYTFSGWSEIPQTMPSNDVTITGSYTHDEYEVGGVIYVINENGADIVKAECNTDEVVVEATVTINGKTYNLIAIDEGAYQDCSTITSLTITDGIQFIMANAFNGCIGLKTLNIGNSIKYIGTKAFGNIGIKADAFTRGSDESLIVECHTFEIPETEIDCFEGTHVEAATLLVDDGLVDNYKTTLPWSMFGTIMGINEYLSSINSVYPDQQKYKIFSIDGRRQVNTPKGVNIIKTNHGVSKVVK